MNTIPIKAVNEYQCPGCVNGPKAPDCPQYRASDKGCTAHVPGTIMVGHGVIALGLPRGFCRFGTEKIVSIKIHSSYAAMLEAFPNLGSKYSLPIWAHLDVHGNTVSRWYSPRTNAGWSMVILGDCTAALVERGCTVLTQADIDAMD